MGLVRCGPTGAGRWPHARHARHSQAQCSAVAGGVLPSLAAALACGCCAHHATIPHLRRQFFCRGHSLGPAWPPDPASVYAVSGVPAMMIAAHAQQSQHLCTHPAAGRSSCDMVRLVPRRSEYVLLIFGGVTRDGVTRPAVWRLLARPAAAKLTSVCAFRFWLPQEATAGSDTVCPSCAQLSCGEVAPNAEGLFLWLKPGSHMSCRQHAETTLASTSTWRATLHVGTGTWLLCPHDRRGARAGGPGGRAGRAGRQAHAVIEERELHEKWAAATASRLHLSTLLFSGARCGLQDEFFAQDSSEDSQLSPGRLQWMSSRSQLRSSICSTATSCKHT
jgi:hypothetical protein